MIIAVSACLVGENVTYRGDSNRNEQVIEILEGHERVLVCPEVIGGLPIPRKPSEIKSFEPLKVVNIAGEDVTEEFYQGAFQEVRKLKKMGVKMAILKKNSPSCGNETVYDGSFSHKVVEGSGVFVSLLKEEGIIAFNEDQINKIKDYIRKEDENGTCIKNETGI